MPTDLVKHTNFGHVLQNLSALKRVDLQWVYTKFFKPKCMCCAGVYPDECFHVVRVLKLRTSTTGKTPYSPRGFSSLKTGTSTRSTRHPHGWTLAGLYSRVGGFPGVFAGFHGFLF